MTAKFQIEYRTQGSQTWRRDQKFNNPTTAREQAAKFARRNPTDDFRIVRIDHDHGAYYTRTAI